MSHPTLPGPAQPYQPPPPRQPGAVIPPAPKSKGLNGWAIAGIVIGALVLFCCGIGTIALVASGSDDKDEQPAARVPSARADSEPDDAGSEGDSEEAAAPAPEGEPDDETAADDTFDLPPGSTLIVNTREGTIEITVKSFETRETSCNKYGSPPERGMYLIADITVKVTEGTGSINPFEFTWVADDGTTADAFSGIFADCGQDLDSAYDMRTGSQRSGTIAFDVADAEGALEYEAGLFGGAAGSWRP